MSEENIKFVQVAAGKTHSLGLDIKHQVWAWGDNTHGQLGINDPTITKSNIPLLVPKFSDYEIKQVVVGECFSAALDVAGFVWSWGCNEHGQLGDGTTMSRTSPGVVVFPQPIFYIEAGDFEIVTYPEGDFEGLFKFYATDGIDIVPDASLFIDLPTSLTMSGKYGIKSLDTFGDTFITTAKIDFVYDRKLYKFVRWIDENNQYVSFVYNPLLNPHVFPSGTELKYRNLHIINDREDIGKNYIALYKSEEILINFRFCALGSDSSDVPIKFLENPTGFDLDEYCAEKESTVGLVIEAIAKKQFTNTVGEYTFLYWKQGPKTSLLPIDDDTNINPHVQQIGSESVKRKLIIEDTLTTINKQYYAIYDINYFDIFLISGKREDGTEINDPKLYLEDLSKFNIKDQYATKNLLDGEFLDTSVKDICFDNSGNKYIFKHWEDVTGDLISEDNTEDVFVKSNPMEFKKRILNITNNGIIIKHYIAVFQFIKKDKDCVLDFESHVNNIRSDYITYEQPKFGNVFDIIGTPSGCWSNSDKKECSIIIDKGDLFQISAKPEITLGDRLFVFTHWETETGNVIDDEMMNPKLLDNYTLQFNYLYDTPHCIPMLSENPSLTYVGITSTDTLNTSDVIINNEYDTRMNFINTIKDSYNISNEIIYETNSSDIKSLTDVIQYHIVNNSSHINNYLNIIFISDMQEGNNEYEWWNRINDEMIDKEFQLNIYILRVLGNTDSTESGETLQYFTEFGNQKPEYVNIFEINTVYDYPEDYVILDKLFDKNNLLCTCPDGNQITVTLPSVNCIETTDNNFTCRCSDGSEIIISKQDANNIDEAIVLAEKECSSMLKSDIFNISEIENICEIKPLDPICGKYVAHYVDMENSCYLTFQSMLDTYVVPDNTNMFNKVGGFDGCWEEDFIEKKCYKRLIPNERFWITAQQYYVYDGIIYEFLEWSGEFNDNISTQNDGRTLYFINSGLELLCGHYIALYKAIGWEDGINCRIPKCQNLIFKATPQHILETRVYKCKRINNRNKWVYSYTRYRYTHVDTPCTSRAKRYPFTINGQRHTCWNKVYGNKYCTGKEGNPYCVNNWSKGSEIILKAISGYTVRGKRYNFHSWNKKILSLNDISTLLQNKRLTEDPNNPPTNPIYIPHSPYALTSDLKQIKFLESEYGVSGIYFCKFITNHNLHITQISGVWDVDTFYNNYLVGNTDDHGNLFLYENFTTGQLSLILVFNSSTGSIDLLITGVPENSNILTNNLTKTDTQVSGSLFWNNNTYIIIDNINDFEQINISGNNIIGLDKWKIYKPSDKKYYTNVEIIDFEEEPIIETYPYIDLDLTYYLTPEIYDDSQMTTMVEYNKPRAKKELGNWKIVGRTYTHKYKPVNDSDIIFIPQDYNHSIWRDLGKTQIITSWKTYVFDRIQVGGWIKTKGRDEKYRIIDKIYDDYTIKIDRPYEGSSSISPIVFEYHPPINTYWFENNSNIVRCSSIYSLDRINTGSWIYSETDNNEIYKRQVVEKNIIYNSLELEDHKSWIFNLILDDPYSGSTTSFLGERLYKQKPQYNLTVNSDIRGIVVSEPGDIYADESDSICVYNPRIVTLYAYPKIGYYLKEWQGDLSGNELTKSINMNNHKSVTAVFSRVKMCIDEEVYLQSEWDRRYWQLETDPTVIVWLDKDDGIHQTQNINNQIEISKDCSIKHCGYYNATYRRISKNNKRYGHCPDTIRTNTGSPHVPAGGPSGPSGPTDPATTEPPNPEDCLSCFKAEAHGIGIVDQDIKVFDIGNTTGCWDDDLLVNHGCCVRIENEIFDIEADEYFDYNNKRYWFKFWKYSIYPITNYEDKTEEQLSPFAHKTSSDAETNRILRFDIDKDYHCGEYVAYYEPEIPYCETCFQATAENLVITDPEIKTFNYGQEEGCWDSDKLEERGCCRHIQNEKFEIEANLYFRIGNKRYNFQYWLGPNGIVTPIEDKTDTTSGPYAYKPFELADVHNKLIFEEEIEQHCSLYVAYYSTEQEIIKPPDPDFQAPIQIVKTAAGHHHMLALEGTVHPDDAEIITSYIKCWSWGKNYYGQLGLGTYTDRTYPHIVEFPDDSILEHIDCGMEHSLGIDQYGRGWAWGDNRYCQLGIDENIEYRNRPTLIRLPEGKKLRDLKGGNKHTIGLTTENDVYIWGHSQCGEGHDPHPHDPVEVNIPDGLEFIKTFAGEDYYAGITLDGQVYMWGNNLFGQLGIGNYDNQIDPQLVVFPYDVKIITMSLNTTHTMALDSLGNIWVWGDNRQEQLGDQTKVNKNTPYHMIGFSKSPLPPEYITPIIPTYPEVILDETEPYYNLTVSITGSGKVKSNPAGINCGEVCTSQFNDEISLTLHAFPSSGYRFKRWEGDITGTDTESEVIVLNRDKTITAIFERNILNIDGKEYTQSIEDPRYWTDENNILYWINENELVYQYGDNEPKIMPVRYSVDTDGYRHVIFTHVTAGDGYCYAWDYNQKAYTWGLLSPYHEYTEYSDERELPSDERMYLMIENHNKNLGVVRNIGNNSVNKINDINCGYECIDEYLRNSRATVECFPYSGIIQDDQSLLTKTILDNRLEIIHLGDGYGTLHIFRNSDDYFEIQADPGKNSIFSRMFGDIYNGKNDYGLVYDGMDEIKTIYVEFSNATNNRILKIDSKYFTVEDPVNSVYCQNSVQEFHIPKDTIITLELINIKEGYSFQGWSGAGVSNTESSRTILMNRDQEIYLEWDNLYERMTLLNHDPEKATITHNGEDDNGNIIVDKYGDLELDIDPIGSNDILSFEYENVIIELYYGSCDFIISKVNQRLVIEAVLDGSHEFDRWEGEYSAKDGLIVSVNVSDRKRIVSIWFKT